MERLPCLTLLDTTWHYSTWHIWVCKAWETGQVDPCLKRCYARATARRERGARNLGWNIQGLHGITIEIYWNVSRFKNMFKCLRLSQLSVLQGASSWMWHRCCWYSPEIFAASTLCLLIFSSSHLLIFSSAHLLICSSAHVCHTLFIRHHTTMLKDVESIISGLNCTVEFQRTDPQCVGRHQGLVTQGSMVLLCTARRTSDDICIHATWRYLKYLVLSVLYLGVFQMLQSAQTKRLPKKFQSKTTLWESSYRASKHHSERHRLLVIGTNLNLQSLWNIQSSCVESPDWGEAVCTHLAGNSNRGM